MRLDLSYAEIAQLIAQYAGPPRYVADILSPQPKPEFAEIIPGIYVETEPELRGPVMREWKP